MGIVNLPRQALPIKDTLHDSTRITMFRHLPLPLPICPPMEIRTDVHRRKKQSLIPTDLLQLSPRTDTRPYFTGRVSDGKRMPIRSESDRHPLSARYEPKKGKEAFPVGC